jgi:hypothetical protein
MLLLRIVNGVNRLNDDSLEARASQILLAMTGNANFPTPSPTLTVLQTAISDFSIALSKAKAGSDYDKAVKNSKREALIVLIHSLSNYVLFTANGDELVAKSSGFTIAKAPSSGPLVTAATNQKLEDGQNPGELKFSFDKVPGATGYIYGHTPDPITPSSIWKTLPGTTRKTVFTGLESGERYWCRVMAIGKGGQGVYSEPISRVVQ